MGLIERGMGNDAREQPWSITVGLMSTDYQSKDGAAKGLAKGSRGSWSFPSKVPACLRKVLRGPCSTWIPLTLQGRTTTTSPR